MTIDSKSESNSPSGAANPAAQQPTKGPADTPAAPIQGTIPGTNPSIKDIEDGKFELAEVEKAARIVHTVLRQEFSGPMPHPDLLERYKQVDPEIAKAIHAEFLANGAHQRRMEERNADLQDRALTGQIEHFRLEDRRDTRSQHYAAALVVVGMVLIGALAYMGQPVVAGVVAGTLLVAVLSAFLTRRAPSSREKPDAAEPSSTEEE